MRIWFLVLFLQKLLGMYKQGCYTGYYPSGDSCLPCHESCKSCSDGDSCDSWEDYMVLQVNGIWINWAEGEYFDRTAETCRSCDGRCNLQCGYQRTWFDWGSGEVYDIESGACIVVSDCTSPKQVITNSQYELGTIWRSLDYYLNPFSEENMELGTIKFPYRSFTVLASEILNVHSHTTGEITIYTTDIYLEDGILVFVNMTNVSIRPHPDHAAINLKNGLDCKNLWEFLYYHYFSGFSQKFKIFQ